MSCAPRSWALQKMKQSTSWLPGCSATQLRTPRMTDVLSRHQVFLHDCSFHECALAGIRQQNPELCSQASTQMGDPSYWYHLYLYLAHGRCPCYNEMPGAINLKGEKGCLPSTSCYNPLFAIFRLQPIILGKLRQELEASSNIHSQEQRE